MRWPAEWEPHERTLMGWPCRTELWGDTLETAKRDYATVANAIAQFEPVTMIANPGEQAEEARTACSEEVEIVELPLDDSWLRDCGPIYLQDPERGRRVAVHFRFNAWGEKFRPWDRDAEIGSLIARELGDEVQEAPMVLEGGSVHTDGAGTIFATEQCLLHPNRNPSLSQAQIESALIEHLAGQRLVWLPHGLLEDRDTDGHVDLVAAPTPDGSVLLQTVPEDNPNFENCRENARRLQEAGVDVIELPLLPYVEVAGERVAASYLNFYVCNGAAIVPVSASPSDEEALALIAEAFPGREIVPVPGDVLAYGGGGPHCITQQVPTRYE
jgi:agmatine deiminase